MQGLREELEGRVSRQIIEENIRYYDSYIAGETAKGASEEEVTEALGGPRIIARTIVDAAYDTEDRPDGYDIYGAGKAQEEKRQERGGGYQEGQQQRGGGYYEERQYTESRRDPHIHYVDFSKWYVKLLAALAVILVAVVILAVFFGLLSLLWPVILVVALISLFRGTRR